MTPEGLVKANVQDFLKKTGRFFIRMQSGRVKVRGGFMYLCPEGTGDILTFDDDGRCVWLEVKQLKGKQREAQENFERRVSEMGHRYCVVRSVEDAVRAVTGRLG
jgi:hypothetical protein